MKKLALGALFVGLAAACGGGDKPVPLADSGVDAPPVGVCNPVAQTGCNANEKCTWIWDQVMPDEIGHIGCAVLAGDEVAVGAACTDGRTEVGMGGDGADNCVGGAVCISRVCKTICDHQAAAAASGCSAEENCGRYSGIFVQGDATVAGACDPKCDILNQNLLGSGGAAACGSPDPAVPTAGCYGQPPSFAGACAAVVEESILLNTDREPPFQEGGNFFLNSCAPGYQVFIVDMTGSMNPTCSGYCAAANISNEGNEPQNDTGLDSATAKLVNQAAPRVGDGRCIAAAKGSAADGQQNCIYLWPFTVNGQNVDIAPEHLDTLGICFTFSQYNFDDDQNPQTPNIPFPDCKTLPKTSTDPNVLTAASLGCQDLATSSAFDSKPRLHPAKRDMRIGHTGANTAIKPHKIVQY